MSARTDLEARVIEIVAAVLGVERSEVTPYSSLIDDLGAESIDFLDLVFRLESAFGIKIPENEIWRGSIEPAESGNPAAIAAAVERLKARMPQFRWNALPERLTKDDLPRLITVRTIVDYLEPRV